MFPLRAISVLVDPSIIRRVRFDSDPESSINPYHVNAFYRLEAMHQLVVIHEGGVLYVTRLIHFSPSFYALICYSPF